jgi:hypothetical protein
LIHGELMMLYCVIKFETLYWHCWHLFYIHR